MARIPTIFFSSNVRLSSIKATVKYIANSETDGFFLDDNDSDAIFLDDIIFRELTRQEKEELNIQQYFGYPSSPFITCPYPFTEYQD